MPEENSSEIVKEQSESVAATNLKVLADGPAFFQNQAYAESNANMAAVNQMRMAILSRATENITSSGQGADVATIGMLIKALQGMSPTSRDTTVPEA